MKKLIAILLLVFVAQCLRAANASFADLVWTNAGSTNIYPRAFPLWNNSVKRTVAYGHGVLSAGNPTDDDNTAIGFNALNGLKFGGDNTALGSRTLEAITNGNHNIALGNYSLQNLKYGQHNIAIGEGAFQIYTNVAGGFEGWNLAIGDSAGASLRFGIQNVIIGHQSDVLGRGVSDATLIGFDAQGNTNDTVIGSQAGQNLGNGGNNVLIGKFADMGGSFNHSNSFAIGSRAIITANNQGVFGKSVFSYQFSEGQITMTDGGLTVKSNSVGPSGTAITNILTGSANLDFPSIPANRDTNMSITVTGCGTNDVVTLGVPAIAAITNMSYFAFPSNDTVWIRALNHDPTTAQNPGPATFKVMVTKW